jgi:DNA repair protein RecN (Recombination protein N)
MPKAQLVELYAHGLGVIDDARAEFGPGFNVLTGETGAGKTLLLGALGLCVGVDAAVPRDALTGEVRAAAVFDLGGSEVALAHEASATGRLRATIDGVPSSVDALRARSSDLIVFHGQRDSLRLRSRAQVLRIVDAAGGVSTSELDDVRRRLARARAERDGLGGDEAARARELDFLDFQIAELEGARILSADELDDTLMELTRLSELHEGQEALARVLEALDSDSGPGVLSQLAQAVAQIPPGAAYEPARQVLRSALAQARDAVHDLAALADPESIDDDRLARLDERAAQLRQLARKFGGTLGDALDALGLLRADRHRHLDAAARAEGVSEEISLLEARERTLARAARESREAAAAALSAAVAPQLARVALAHARLRVEVGGDDGSHVRLLFTPNPGRAEGPLASLASGGELSRVLLALSLETVHDDVVAVFDEVDAGIGGQVAQQIGECLFELGRQQQVLAVTHLASVAARAEHHFVIDKRVQRGRTSVVLRRVEGEARVAEIARMLAGDQLSDESRALAHRLLETSR